MNHDPLTIIHVIAQLRLGAGRYVADTAIEQARRHRVTVCVSTDADEYWRTDPRLVSELGSHGIAVRTIGDFFHRRTDLLRSAAARLRELREASPGPVIVHAHTAMAAAVGHWAQPDTLVATCHGWAACRPAEIDLQDSLAYQLCDAVVTYSRHWADRLTGDLASPSPTVLPMGLDLDRFPPLPCERRNASRPFRIVTVCELIRRKGVDLLLNAMPAIWQHQPETELHIIGDGDSAGELRRLAAALEPKMKKVLFYGALANPYEHLKGFDLFVLASRSDNLPVVLLEAMLARLPLAAAGVGGVPDLISAAGSGMSLSPESSMAIADGVLAMMQLGDKSLAALGGKGERYVRRHWDVRRTALKMEGVYRAALRNKGRGRRDQSKSCSNRRPDSILSGTVPNPGL